MAEERMRRNLTVKQVADRLGLAPQFIEWVETGAYKKLPGEVYTKNFIKRYAELFGILSTQALSQYMRERDSNISLRKENTHVPSSHYLHWSWPSVIKKSFVGVSMLMIIGYIGWQTKHIFAPPPLTIETPREGQIMQNGTVALQGTSLPETKIQINGRELITDPRGHFTEMLDLVPGNNRITVVAIQKHGARTTSIRNIIFEEKVSLAPAGNGVH